MTRVIKPVMRVIPLLVLFFASSLLICHAGDKKMKMHKNAKALKQEIVKLIPIGSSIKDAQRIMEANGFECALTQRDTFAEIDEHNKVTMHRDIDFLYCDKETRAWLLCLRRWQVAIVHKSGMVSDILVSIGLICP